MQPRVASLSGVQLNWKKVESSLRSTSLGVSPAVARQLQSLGSFKNIPSKKTRRATDSNLVLEAPRSAFSQVVFSAMAKARQGRQATEGSILDARKGTEPRPGPFSPSDDEEDRHSERLPDISDGMKGASGLSASGAAAAVALSRSFSRRRRAADSEALPGLGPIQEKISGRLEETLAGSPGISSADPEIDADAHEDEEEDVKVSKIRSV